MLTYLLCITIIAYTSSAPKRASTFDEVTVKFHVPFLLDIRLEIGQQPLDYLNLAVSGGDK